MRLTYSGVAGTGLALLDAGIGRFLTYENGSGTFLFSTTGRSGGLAGYRINDDGTLSLGTSLPFPDNMNLAVDEALSLVQNGSGTMLAVGSNARGLMGFAINGSGEIGARQLIDWQAAETGAAETGNGLLGALLTMEGRPLSLFAAAEQPDQIVTLESAVVEGREFVLTLSAADNALKSFERDSGTGALSLRDTLGAAQGVPIVAPTAMELVQLGGVTYAVVAAAATSSLTVIELGAGGALAPTDHVIDTGATRFAQAQALTAVSDGQRAFVAAGGGDHGVSVFTLLPGGRLVTLDSFAHDGTPGLHNVSALSMMMNGTHLHLFAASQRDSGITRLSMPVEMSGTLASGGQGQARVIEGTDADDLLLARADGDTLLGGAGDDILVAGPGRTLMRGGPGRDLFVVTAENRLAQIADFRPGDDRLDLSDWPMLRDVGQLNFITTPNGARIIYRDNEVRISADDGNPLGVDDVFAGGFHWADRIPLMPVEPPPPEPPAPPPPPPPPPPESPPPPPAPPPPEEIDPFRGRRITGTDGDDTLVGGLGNDTLLGYGGNDLIDVGSGNNVVWGGAGDDTIIGGPGDDMLRGALGADLMFATAGNNDLRGMRGADTLHGGSGNDNLNGGGANDLIYGNEGNNTLFGGNGNDVLYGGTGNDTLMPGSGRDFLHSGSGPTEFRFYRENDRNVVFDFNPDNGDVLMLSSGLLRRFANRDMGDNMRRFGEVNSNGDVRLDFSSVNGETQIILIGYGDLDALADHVFVL